MYGAARGGHKDLVDFFISKGADDWNLGMYGAVLGMYKSINSEHKDLVDFFISKGANNWKLGKKGAKLSKNKTMLKFFKNKIKQEKNI